MLNQHSYNDSIKSHCQINHNKRNKTCEQYQNTKILHKGTNHQRLRIKKCILILKEKPQINKQYQNFTNIITLYNTNASNIIQKILTRSEYAPLTNQLGKTHISYNFSHLNYKFSIFNQGVYFTKCLL